MSVEPHVWQVNSFDQWRAISRWLLQNDVPPSAVLWIATGQQASLLSGNSVDSIPVANGASSAPAICIPANFLTLAEQVACHREPARWNLLYTALWRLTHGERHLLELAADDLTRRLAILQKQVTRDCHKMKAFVRFTKVAEEPQEIFVAWYRPDHDVLRLVAPFFSRRFKSMDWTIWTPYASARWDGQALQFSAGVDASQAPSADALVGMWQDYYRSIFNPARIKTDAMKREMPVRFWKHLPEAATIPDLLREAPARVEQMHVKASELARSAQSFIPSRGTLIELWSALERCEGCELCRNGTRVVPGVGPENARWMIVGEQPGDLEEQQGLPFVGPAGQLLNRLLDQAELNRSAAYVTNVVKHFHHELQGKRRLHQRPSARHEAACKPWLTAEVERIRPQVVLGLGITALHALLGRQHKLSDVIGKMHPSWASQHTIVTWHPASILRTDGTLVAQREQDLLSALLQVRRLLTKWAQSS